MFLERMGDKITESEVDIVDDAESLRRKYNEDGKENMFISKKVLSTSSTFVCVALSFLWKTPQKKQCPAC